MLIERVGAIDDPIWLTTPEMPSRRSLGLLITGVSALVMVVVPLVCFFTRGLDWEAALFAAALVLPLLVLVQRRWVGPALLSLGLVLGLLVLVEGVNAGSYHTLRLDRPPLRLEWCGRTYSNPTPASANSPLAHDLRASVRVEALMTPSGTAIYAKSPCSAKVGQTLLFSPSSGGVLVYSLEGGP
jgi:hypothetical protein